MKLYTTRFKEVSPITELQRYVMDSTGLPLLKLHDGYSEYNRDIIFTENYTISSTKKIEMRSDQKV